MRAVRTTWLEMRSAGDLRRSRTVPRDALLVRAGVPSPELSRFLYSAVGGPWHWHERLGWDWARWMDWLDRPEVETWVLHQIGTPAGYFELEAQAGGEVEITYVGLIPGFTGQGLGGYLLTQAAHRAWRMGEAVSRVWLHTCSLDHPAALANYLARGFVISKEEDTVVDLPEESPGPWPGAARPQ